MITLRGHKYITFMRRLARGTYKLLFRAEVFGKENIPAEGVPCIYVANHLSFIDPPLIFSHLPMPTTWPVSIFASRKWYFKLAHFLNPVDVFRMDPTNPLSVRALMRFLKENPKTRCVIFPEGRLTRHSSVMKFYDGTGLIAAKLGLKIVPISIEGLEFTPFGHCSKILAGLFPKVRMTIQPAQDLKMPEERMSARDRRRFLGEQLYNIYVAAKFRSYDANKTIFEDIRAAAFHFGLKKQIMEDAKRAPVTYKTILLGAEVLGRKLTEFTQPKENVGVMLPNAIGTVVTFLGLNKFGRTPAMINFTAGLQNVKNACKTAEIKTVLTSREFIEKARLENLVEGLKGSVNLQYLEDIRQTISLKEKLLGLLHYKKYTPMNTPDDPAVVLFTSGSEGTPKGVVLSHKNLLANVYQLRSVCGFYATDRLFSCLPIFHSFGLMGGVTLPLITGIRTFLYPSPLHIRLVPEMIYDDLSTIMFGTDTFLSRYAKFAHPYDLHTIRLCFAGAEQLKAETRKVYMEKFGVRILEGYGVTETSPGLAINTPHQNRSGTVGRLLPDIEYKLEPVAGIEEGQRLFVKGPNVMTGYLKVDKPGKLQPLKDGWYDTGDVVTIDADGYVKIVGRAKRFAKIGGEMISLAAAENFINSLWPNKTHAVIAQPDDRKGEALLLVTEFSKADRKEILEEARKKGVGELFVPRAIKHVEKVPLLGSGKIDYPAVEKLIAEK